MHQYHYEYELSITNDESELYAFLNVPRLAVGWWWLAIAIAITITISSSFLVLNSVHATEQYTFVSITLVIIFHTTSLSIVVVRLQYLQKTKLHEFCLCMFCVVS